MSKLLSLHFENVSAVLVGKTKVMIICFAVLSSYCIQHCHRWCHMTLSFCLCYVQLSYFFLLDMYVHSMHIVFCPLVIFISVLLIYIEICFTVRILVTFFLICFFFCVPSYIDKILQLLNVCYRFKSKLQTNGSFKIKCTSVVWFVF